MEPTGDSSAATEKNSGDLGLIRDATNWFLIITALVWPAPWSAKQLHMANIQNSVRLKQKVLGCRFHRPETGFTCCSSLPRYRPGVWHDWVWGVKIWPMGLRGFAVWNHFTIWVWVHTHHTPTDTPVLPIFHSVSTSHSSSSRAGWGCGQRGAGSIRLSTAQADKEEGSWGTPPHQCGCSAAAWF